MLRIHSTEAVRCGRFDFSRALDAAYDRSARLEIPSGPMTRLDRLGIRGATRIPTWLERGNIYD
jgi:hypothetical protein